MIFTVTYRGTDGTIRQEAVEAATRTECLTECRKRGITPKTIKEGADAKMANRKANGGNGRKAALALVAVLVLLAIGAAFWSMKHTSAGGADVKRDTTDRPKSVKVKEVTPVKVERRKSETKVAVNSTLDKVKKDTSATNHPPPGTVLSVRTNDNNLVITEVVGPNGKPKLLTKELHPPVFSNPADQLIAAAMSAAMTGQMAPLPLGPEADLYFKEALKKPILDKPDDSDEVKRMKQVVRETRKEIAALMAEGQSFAEILAQHRELWNENVKIREDAVAEYKRIVASGDEEEAQKYMTAINGALGDMGIPPLTEKDGHSRRKQIRKEQVEQ